MDIPPLSGLENPFTGRTPRDLWKRFWVHLVCDPAWVNGEDIRGREVPGKI